MGKGESTEFNIYYLNFSKVYEIAMMINNVILTKVERGRAASFEKQYGFTSSISAQGTKQFLDGIKATISADAKETSFSSEKVVETLDVKTTKSILLRRVIEQCTPATIVVQEGRGKLIKTIKEQNAISEGDLIKIDKVKLELQDEESLRQFLILKRDALKGFRVEGMELNNLISSALQDYAYILKGTVDDKTNINGAEVIIKIPLEIQSEFENKYSIDDLLIGHVSIIGIYKGDVKREFITSNTFNYLQESNIHQNQTTDGTTKSFRSATSPKVFPKAEKDNGLYHFIDTLAIIQNVAFKQEESQVSKLHWWNKVRNWLSRLRRV